MHLLWKLMHVVYMVSCHTSLNQLTCPNPCDCIKSTAQLISNCMVHAPVHSQWPDFRTAGLWGTREGYFTTHCPSQGATWHLDK